MIYDNSKNYFLAIKDTNTNFTNTNKIVLKCVGNQSDPTLPLQTLYINDITGLPDFPANMLNTRNATEIPAAPYFLLYKK